MKNETKSDVTYLLMKMTKITDRVDVLENKSNDENEATKSVGAVNMEFTGKLLKITVLSVHDLDFIYWCPELWDLTMNCKLMNTFRSI